MLNYVQNVVILELLSDTGFPRRSEMMGENYKSEGILRQIKYLGDQFDITDLLKQKVSFILIDFKSFCRPLC